MVGQQIDALQGRQTGGEDAYRADVLLVVVEPRDDRDAEGDAMTLARKPLVSRAVCRPLALHARSNWRTESGCASGSPPEKVTPPDSS